MKLPANLLNAVATIYKETNVKGTMGQPTQALVKVITCRCRVDQKSTFRYIQKGNFEQTLGRYTVYLPGIQSQPIEQKYWMRIQSDTGLDFVAQVESIRLPSLGDHHTEIEVIRRKPSLAVPA
jgi:hypothetical protein